MPCSQLIWVSSQHHLVISECKSTASPEHSLCDSFSPKTNGKGKVLEISNYCAKHMVANYRRLILTTMKEKTFFWDHKERP